MLLCEVWVVVCREPMTWIHADASSKRLDEKYLVSKRVQMPLPHLADLLPDVSAVIIFHRNYATCVCHAAPIFAVKCGMLSAQ